MTSSHSSYDIKGLRNDESVQNRYSNLRHRGANLDGESLFATSKTGKKKIEKLKRKEDRRQFNLWRQQQRAEQLRLQELMEEEEENRLEEQKKMEKKRQRLEERERLALLERNKVESQEWKRIMNLEEQNGIQARGEEEERALEAELIERLMNSKIVRLVDLALEYELPVQELKVKMTGWMNDNKVQGVFDDRGQFVCLRRSQLEEIARFIVEKGRISKHELALKCNEIVNISSHDTFVTENDDDNDDEFEDLLMDEV